MTMITMKCDTEDRILSIEDLHAYIMIRRYWLQGMKGKSTWMADYTLLASFTPSSNILIKNKRPYDFIVVMEYLNGPRKTIESFHGRSSNEIFLLYDNSQRPPSTCHNWGLHSLYENITPGRSEDVLGSTTSRRQELNDVETKKTTDPQAQEIKEARQRQAEESVPRRTSSLTRRM